MGLRHGAPRGVKKPRAAIPSEGVRREWLRRVEAEYRSAALTQHLTLWLIQIGASPDLVRAGMRIAADEIVHAELSHRAYVAAGGEGGPSLVRETLELTRTEGEPLEHDVARVAVEIFCLGETVAVPLFKELREPCTVPVARRALDRILKDEVRHRDFGWTLLGWLFELPMAEDLRRVVDRELPSWFARLRMAYAPRPKSEEPVLTPEERAWGLMPVSLYRACVEKTLARDWQPRFTKLGVDVRAAW
ncbi:MAG: ferritin-like domain-containing protein [Deltaproteobacteria bacterium]|nr:ferritin-like domain-containing protein [Deltaproteobacteria bacterium]